jgi:hypothetical protein
MLIATHVRFQSQFISVPNLPAEKKLIGPSGLKHQTLYSDKKKENVLVPGEDRKVTLEPGDGMIYKGCERPHWREAMPGANRSKKLFGKGEELYYHQIFFHYVLQDGQRAHCAFDAAR